MHLAQSKLADADHATVDDMKIANEDRSQCVADEYSLDPGCVKTLLPEVIRIV